MNVVLVPLPKEKAKSGVRISADLQRMHGKYRNGPNNYNKQ